MPHNSESRMLVTAFDGNDYLGFSLGASTSWSWLLRPDKRIVHFHQASQLIQGIPVLHGLANLLQHGPGALDADVDFAGQSKGREATFVCSHQVDGPEPFDERGSGAVHDSTSSQRCPVLALNTLIQFTFLKIVRLVTGHCYGAIAGAA